MSGHGILRHQEREWIDRMLAEQVNPGARRVALLVASCLAEARANPALADLRVTHGLDAEREAAWGIARERHGVEPWPGDAPPPPGSRVVVVRGSSAAPGGEARDGRWIVRETAAQAIARRRAGG